MIINYCTIAYTVVGMGWVFARGFSIKINEFQKTIKQNPKNDDFNFFSLLVSTDDATMS